MFILFYLFNCFYQKIERRINYSVFYSTYADLARASHFPLRDMVCPNLSVTTCRVKLIWPIATPWYTDEIYSRCSFSEDGIPDKVCL